MKKIYQFLFIVFLSYNFSIVAKAQTNYNMSNGMDITTCSGFFNDNGGPTGNYTNNQNIVAVFRSPAGEKLQFTFQQFDLTQLGGDSLIVYDGPSTANGIIGILTGNSIPAPIISSSGAVTFRFSSNLANTSAGWVASIQCIAPPIGCPNAPVPSDFYGSAPLLCNGAVFCGNTSNFYTPDFPNNLCSSCSLFTGTIENNGWYAFKAGTGPAYVSIQTQNCVSLQGIQYAAYAVDTTGDFILISKPAFSDIGTDGIINDTLHNLLPNKLYYIMIDGYAGDVCDFSIVVTGIKHPTLGITQSFNSCPGNSILLASKGGVQYNWTSVPPDGELVNQSSNNVVILHPLVNSVYTVNIKDTLLCNIDTNLSVNVNILSAASNECQGPQDFCNVNASASQTTIGLGQSTTLSVSGSPVVQILNAGFNDGTTPTGFNIIGDVAYGFSTGIGFDGSDYPWFYMGSSREIVTPDLDISNGGKISFYIKFGKNNNIEKGPNTPNKGICLEYSKDGGVTWELIRYFNPVTCVDELTVDNNVSPALQIDQITPLMNWKHFGYSIPLLAQSSQTRFRWKQNFISLPEEGLWGLDSINIYHVANNPTISWSSIPADAGLNPVLNTQNVSPVQTTSYIASVSDGVMTCYDTVVVNVDQAQNCNASFNSNVISQTLIINNNSTGFYQKVFWDFGDGSFSNNNNLGQHIYNNQGFYNVTLSILDTISMCQDDTSIVVAIGNVSSVCHAKIYHQDLGSNTIAFADSSLGAHSGCTWFFGDGSTSNDLNPVHSYSQPGFYNVRLMIGNNSGFVSNDRKLISVGNTSQDCEAAFIYYSNLQLGRVLFSDRSAGNALDTYLWNFGDGSTSLQQSPVHNFAAPGFYNVCLTVGSNTTGCINTRCRSIKVGDDSLSCYAKYAVFVDSAQLKAKFFNQSLGGPYSNKWTFGDNTLPSHLTNPEHTYANPGLYPVHLRVLNPVTQCVDHYVELVNVAMPTDSIAAAFIYVIDSTSSKANQYPVKFKGTAFGDPARFSWDFGDGSDRDTTTLDPTHVYASDGLYHVCFTVSDENTVQESEYCEDLLVNDQTVGYSSLNMKNLVICYPNPFSNATNIVFRQSKDGDAIVQISDVFGHLVQYNKFSQQKAGLYEYRWNAEELPSGLYFVSIQTPDFTSSQKLVLSR